MLEEFWEALYRLVFALEAAPLRKHADAWAVAIDDRWWVTVNGHGSIKTAAKVPIPGAGGMAMPEVLPFHALVYCDGWPFAMCGTDGAVVAAGHTPDGDFPSFQTLIDALNARWRREVASYAGAS